MTAHTQQTANGADTRKLTRDKWLDSLGWGLFFVMIGVLWLLPEGYVREDAWLIGVGSIILGINGIRYLSGISIQRFWTAIGVLVLLFGVNGVYGIEIPVFQMLLILFGVSIILRPWKDFGDFTCFTMKTRSCCGNSEKQ